MHLHRALFIREFLTGNNMILLPHLPYSPDLASADFVFFPKMKIQLKDCRFDIIARIQRES